MLFAWFERLYGFFIVRFRELCSELRSLSVNVLFFSDGLAASYSAFLYEKAYMGVLAYYRGVRDNSYLHKWDFA